MAGFSKRGPRMILGCDYAFIDTLDERGIDPSLTIRNVESASSLYARDRLGRLFNEVLTARSPAHDNLFAASGAEQPRERALIEPVTAATKLYDSSEAIQELFAFTICLRELEPFNAMLLHIQKPGL